MNHRRPGSGAGCASERSGRGMDRFSRHLRSAPAPCRPSRSQPDGRRRARSGPLATVSVIHSPSSEPAGTWVQAATPQPADQFAGVPMPTGRAVEHRPHPAQVSRP